MDNSETYIKMCDKAEEIQLLFDEGKFDLGSFWYRGNKKDVVTNKGYAFHRYFLKLGDVWLPRQDQLQGMIRFDFPMISRTTQLVQHLWWFVNDYHLFPFSSGKIVPTSMEQLWLAYVMKEKFIKEWNGEDWVLKDKLTASEPQVAERGGKK